MENSASSPLNSLLLFNQGIIWCHSWLSLSAGSSTLQPHKIHQQSLNSSFLSITIASPWVQTTFYFQAQHYMQIESFHNSTQNLTVSSSKIPNFLNTIQNAWSSPNLSLQPYLLTVETPHLAIPNLSVPCMSHASFQLQLSVHIVPSVCNNLSPLPFPYLFIWLIQPIIQKTSLPLINHPWTPSGCYYLYIS